MVLLWRRLGSPIFLPFRFSFVFCSFSFILIPFSFFVLPCFSSLSFLFCFSLLCNIFFSLSNPFFPINPPLCNLSLQSFLPLYLSLLSVLSPVFFFFPLVERGIYKTGEAGATLPLSNPEDRVECLKRPLCSRLSCLQGSPI